MAHFAKIENNVVTQIIVAEQEFIDSGALGDPSVWKQTSYNGTIRTNYAGIGYLYIEEIDAFVPPSPFPSWSLNLNTGIWEAPIPKPDNNQYIWNETSQSWEEYTYVLPVTPQPSEISGVN